MSRPQAYSTGSTSSLPPLSIPFPRPTSPALSHRSSTATSAAGDFAGAPSRIISKKDLRASLQAFEDLLTTSQSYRSSLLALSTSRASFALSIERCARLKGVSPDSSSGLLAAGGLHYLISNQEQVLAETVGKGFEQPLREVLEGYRKSVTERTISYERAQSDLSRQIRSTEAANLLAARKRTRDLSSFRAALAALQAQVDTLDQLKAEYYSSVLAFEEETWDQVLARTSHVVRSTLDIYERISQKGTDAALEPMLTANPDPFNAYGAMPEGGEDKLFSILTPLGMMSPSLGGGGYGGGGGGKEVPAAEDQAQEEETGERGEGGEEDQGTQAGDWSVPSSQESSFDKPHWGYPEGAAFAHTHTHTHAGVNGTSTPRDSPPRPAGRKSSGREQLTTIDETLPSSTLADAEAEADDTRPGRSRSVTPTATAGGTGGLLASVLPAAAPAVDTPPLITDLLPLPAASSTARETSPTGTKGGKAVNPYFPDVGERNDPGELEPVRDTELSGLEDDRLLGEPAPWEGARSPGGR